MSSSIVAVDALAGRIHLVRGQRVMLDSDLAELYGVATKVFNQAIKRNGGRFPADFMFQLTADEHDSLRSQFVTLNADESLRSQIEALKAGRGQHRKYLPKLERSRPGHCRPDRRHPTTYQRTGEEESPHRLHCRLE